MFRMALYTRKKTNKILSVRISEVALYMLGGQSSTQQLVICSNESKIAAEIIFKCFCPHVTFYQTSKFETWPNWKHLQITILFYLRWCSSSFPKQAQVFMCLQYKSFENTVGKGEIAPNEQFLLFPVFSTLLENLLPFSSKLKLSSAKSFSLEASKICRLGKG